MFSTGRDVTLDITVGKLFLSFELRERGSPPPPLRAGAGRGTRTRKFLAQLHPPRLGQIRQIGVEPMCDLQFVGGFLKSATGLQGSCQLIVRFWQVIVEGER